MKAHANDPYVAQMNHTPHWMRPKGKHRYTGSSTWQGGKKISEERCHKCNKRSGARVHRYPESYARCSWCGSISLYDLIDHHVPDTYSWADFKYGWPHKLYVDVRTNDRLTDTNVKFYTTHLRDTSEHGLSMFNEMFGTVHRFSFQDDKLVRIPAYKLTFSLDDVGLKWEMERIDSQ